VEAIGSDLVDASSIVVLIPAIPTLAAIDLHSDGNSISRPQLMAVVIH